jgi:hypothetical protein
MVVSFPFPCCEPTGSCHTLDALSLLCSLSWCHPVGERRVPLRLCGCGCGGRGGAASGAGALRPPPGTRRVGRRGGVPPGCFCGPGRCARPGHRQPRQGCVLASMGTCSPCCCMLLSTCCVLHAACSDTTLCARLSLPCYRRVSVRSHSRSLCAAVLRPGALPFVSCVCQACWSRFSSSLWSQM